MPDRFLDAMRLLAGAVTVVSAGEDEIAAGLTATAVCSFSADPPRLLVCLNRAGSTFKALLETGQFCVNILAADQQDIALDFAGRTGKAGSDKFSDSDWNREPGFAPRHDKALASVRCSTHFMTIIGTHAVIVGDVVETHLGTRRDSLIYRDGVFV